MFYAQMPSPLGHIVLCSNGTSLNGLYFVGQNDCPSLAGLPPAPPQAADPTAGTMNGIAIRTFKAFKRQDLQSDLFDQEGLATMQHSGDARLHVAGDLLFMQAYTPADAQALFKQTRDELLAYFAGRLTVFSVDLHTDGTPFQKQVWDALIAIPYGEFVSYGDVARTVGLTAHYARAVGTAVGRNPISIIIPCHRVLSGGGTLNGYSGGLARKHWLLEREGFTLR